LKVAVIPARGGSKRIPRKNIREFAGKPMIAHSIDCARQSGLFDRIIVSTDDPEISRVAQEFGAEVPFVRPAALADDHAGTTVVIAQAVKWLQDSGVTLSAVCCIYATAPFMRREDIAEGWRLLQTGEWQYVFAATRFVASVHRSFLRATNGGLEMIFPEHFDTRSQDLPTVLHDAAQFYWGRPEAWLTGVRVFDRHSTIVEIPPWRVQDIDTEDDWLQAEATAASLGVQSPGALETLSARG
jgi:pseudaminic acid cytidylyltransferase